MRFTLTKETLKLLGEQVINQTKISKMTCLDCDEKIGRLQSKLIMNFGHIITWDEKTGKMIETPPVIDEMNVFDCEIQQVKDITCVVCGSKLGKGDMFEQQEEKVFEMEGEVYTNGFPIKELELENNALEKKKIIRQFKSNCDYNGHPSFKYYIVEDDLTIIIEQTQRKKLSELLEDEGIPTPIINNALNFQCIELVELNGCVIEKIIVKDKLLNVFRILNKKWR